MTTITTEKIDVDQLANEIRRVDGAHSLGAGALAEALMPFITRAIAERAMVPQPQGQALPLWRAEKSHDLARAYDENGDEIAGGYAKEVFAFVDAHNASIRAYASQLALPAGRDEQVLELHRKLAAETLRADQGWSRYEAANAARNRAEAELAESAGALPAGPVPEEKVRALVDALKGVIRVADRQTVEFDSARAALAAMGEEK